MSEVLRMMVAREVEGDEIRAERVIDFREIEDSTLGPGGFLEAVWRLLQKDLNAEQQQRKQRHEQKVEWMASLGKQGASNG